MPDLETETETDELYDLQVGGGVFYPGPFTADAAHLWAAEHHPDTRYGLRRVDLGNSARERWFDPGVTRDPD